MALAKQSPPADPGEAQKLDDFLCFAIYSTNLAVNRLNKPLLDELGLTYLQYIVLVALYEQDDQTVGGLGDRLFLDSSTLTPLLKRLETMGHLTRQRDPEDERQVRVRLTPQGRSVRERAFGFRSRLVKAMGLGAADFQHLREELVKLRANLSDPVRAKPQPLPGDASRDTFAE
jgi:DNA-binding MarR family transcriptional regulator